MKWNDIREKIKNPTDSMNVRAEKTAVVNSDALRSLEQHHKFSKRATLVIVGAILVLIAIIIIWCIQSRKVENFGPATDAGLTREQAKEAQGFLIQAQPKPLTEAETKEIDEFFQSVERKNSAAATVPATAPSN